MCSSGDFGPLHWIPCHAGTKLTIAAEAAHFACSIPNLACHENPAALSRVSESICNNQAAVPLSGSQAEQTSSTCDNCRERISALLWGQPSISAVAATIPGLCHAEPWSENVAKTILRTPLATILPYLRKHGVETLFTSDTCRFLLFALTRTIGASRQ